MKNYTETTLQNAIAKCKKNGGRFWREDCPNVKYYIHSEWGIIDQISNGVMKTEIKDFELKWLYEQPQTSVKEFVKELEELQTMIDDRDSMQTIGLSMLGPISRKLKEIIQHAKNAKKE